MIPRHPCPCASAGDRRRCGIERKMVFQVGFSSNAVVMWWVVLLLQAIFHVFYVFVVIALPRWVFSCCYLCLSSMIVTAITCSRRSMWLQVLGGVVARLEDRMDKMEKDLLGMVEVVVERVVDKVMKHTVQGEATRPPKPKPCGGPSIKKHKRKRVFKDHLCINYGSVCITQVVERSTNSHSVGMPGFVHIVKPLRVVLPYNTKAFDEGSVI